MSGTICRKKFGKLSLSQFSANCLSANCPVSEQERRPSGNGDREAIVVGADLCDGEGERAYTAYPPHYNIFASRTKVFSRLEDVSATKTFRSNSTAFQSIPAIRSKGSTSVLSTRKIRPIYSHPYTRLSFPSQTALEQN